jgi:hypothetical protein
MLAGWGRWAWESDSLASDISGNPADRLRPCLGIEPELELARVTASLRSVPTQGVSEFVNLLAIS